VRTPATAPGSGTGPERRCIRAAAHLSRRRTPWEGAAERSEPGLERAALDTSQPRVIRI